MADKVIDIEERIPKLRDRRKKRTNRKFLVLLIILLILLVLLVYNQSPYSKIRQIEVAGNELFGKEVYLKATGLTIGESMWSFSPSDIKNEIEQLEWVRKAEVDRNWLTAVEVTVEEYNQVGFLEEKDGYRVMLANGYATEVQGLPITGPLLSGFEESDTKERIAAQLAELDSDVYQLVSEVFRPQPEERPAAVVLYMNDGNEVHALMSSLAEKLNHYPDIAAQLPAGQKGVIDTEVGIFFQPYELPGQSAAEMEATAESADNR
ncbi:cell division protein FtsQ/DivIB [Planococcus lenghuensis]|uniref:Cell division protein DivIB n=1 Tax=Planococcus lenghuensis TaxID=2213202 RepID=A0A1Q2L019_9BACL|nr:FtsQ-type POTRA domain-containing protein [Planococcus lenghuensis]AQQ53795.1 hypothetical protein B0X71_12340 [Planococcus lenghuensis]